MKMCILNMKFNFRLLIVVLLTNSFLLHAEVIKPEINIGTMFDYLKSGQSTLLKKVRNSGGGTAYVEVSISEIIYDSNGNAKEEPVKGVASEQDVRANTLVVSPTRLIISPNGVHNVRLLYMGSRDKERYFRVRFIPVLPNVDDFKVSENEISNYKKKLTAGVSVVSAYGSIVIVNPANVKFKTEIKKQEGHVSVKNTGTGTVILDAIQICSKTTRKCEPMRREHVLPSSSKLLPLKGSNVTMKLKLIEGDKIKSVEL
ncbi:hypothetical protein [Enterobacter bugandensis]